MLRLDAPRKDLPVTPAGGNVVRANGRRRLLLSVKSVMLEFLRERQALLQNGGTLGRCPFRSRRLLWKPFCRAFTTRRSVAASRTSRQRAASLHGSTTAAGPRKRLSTGPSLVIGRCGLRPALRRGCTRPRCASSPIASMPKKPRARPSLADRLCGAQGTARRWQARTYAAQCVARHLRSTRSSLASSSSIRSRRSFRSRRRSGRSRETCFGCA